MHHQTFSQFIDKPCLIHIKNRALLMVRSKGQKLFYIPGGKRKKTESPLEALSREINEELSVSISKDTVRKLFILEAPAHNKPEGIVLKLTCFLAEFDGELKPNAEIEEYKYLTNSDYNLTPEAGVILMQKLKAMDLID